ncbi:vWA domain-containing protein [Spirillospora albida]|uniref:vWA domain-containing protein n=1 Tax=Spirillospora albida TaxID=58123 RepID=UPI0004BFE6C1|nr:VWA domain-containing protein [Spirillospora albida]
MRDVTETMVGFARTLRAAGGPADPQRVQTMLEAVGHLDVLDPGDVYWAGRLALCAGPADIERYDRCFAAYFSGATPRPGRKAPPVVVRRAASPRPGDGEGGDGRALRSAASSTVEVLRDRDVGRLTAAERAEVARLIAVLDAGAEHRPSRRFAPAPGGRIDPARTVRETLRRGGEIAPLRRTRRTRPRRVVIIVDVSGSMSPYADALLRFAHAAARSGGRGVEVFSAGTRLTRLTRELRFRDPDAAMAAASAAIPDWSGGTRLGEELEEFLDRFGQRGLARGAIVVVASDGWERGDAALLGEQMARLRRLAHRVIWANPHRARPGYAPLTAGMAAALPHVDDFTSGHSLGALAALAHLIKGRPHARRPR